MNTIDAVCDACGWQFEWLSGSPQVCGRCQRKKLDRTLVLLDLTKPEAFGYNKN